MTTPAKEPAKPASSPTPPAAKGPEVFFDGRSGQYWLRLPRRFLKLDGRDVKLHAINSGIDIDEYQNGMKKGDRLLLKAQLERHVDYAGALAGHKLGRFASSSGLSVLVTSEAKQVNPKEGKWRTLEGFIFGLLGDVQARYFLMWLKCATEALWQGSLRPGQVLVLAGPGGTGKGFLQYVITQALGGRAESPWRYLSGVTAFNADLASAEHWCIEDVPASTDMRSRRKFGENLKASCVAREMSVHQKGKTAITLPSFRRVTLSVNEEPENLMIVPPLDPSIADKIMLFRCRPGAAAEHLSEIDEKNQSMVARELPGLLHQVSKMVIVEKDRDQRFGVRAYHDGELLELLQQTENHERLLELIDEAVFNGPAGSGFDGLEDDGWHGSADKLHAGLLKSSIGFSVEKLLYFSGACGTYLGRLRGRHGDRINGVWHHGKRVWWIKPPAGWKPGR